MTATAASKSPPSRSPLWVHLHDERPHVLSLVAEHAAFLARISTGVAVALVNAFSWYILPSGKDATNAANAGTRVPDTETCTGPSTQSAQTMTRSREYVRRRGIFASVAHAVLRAAVSGTHPLARLSIVQVKAVTQTFVCPVNPLTVRVHPAAMRVLSTDKLSSEVRKIAGLPPLADPPPFKPYRIPKSPPPAVPKGQHLLHAEWIVHKDVFLTSTGTGSEKTTAPVQSSAPSPLPSPPASPQLSGKLSRPLVTLHFHGGAYYFGTPGTHRGIASELSRATSTRVFSVDYRLAPDYRFPCAIEDAVVAYLYLLGGACEESAVSGVRVVDNDAVPLVTSPFLLHPDASRPCLNAVKYRPEDIIVCGDSSGGGLVMSLMLALKKLRLPLPRAVVLMSPHVDASFSQDSWIRNSESCFMCPNLEGCKGAMEYYANEAPVEHFLISPVNGDLSGLPPTLIQCGELETLVDDSRLLYQRMCAAGCSVEFEEYPDAFHVFQAFLLFSDAKRAYTSIRRFVDTLSSSAPFMGQPRQVHTTTSNKNSKSNYGSNCRTRKSAMVPFSTGISSILLSHFKTIFARAAIEEMTENKHG